MVQFIYWLVSVAMFVTGVLIEDIFLALIGATSFIMWRIGASE